MIFLVPGTTSALLTQSNSSNVKLRPCPRAAPSPRAASYHQTISFVPLKEESSLQCSNSDALDYSASGRVNPEWEDLWAGRGLTSSEARVGLQLRRRKRRGHNLSSVCRLWQLLAHLQQVAGAELGGIKLCLVLQYF